VPRSSTRGSHASARPSLPAAAARRTFRRRQRLSGSSTRSMPGSVRRSPGWGSARSRRTSAQGSSRRSSSTATCSPVASRRRVPGPVPCRSPTPRQLRRLQAARAIPPEARDGREVRLLRSRLLARFRVRRRDAPVLAEDRRRDHIGGERTGPRRRPSTRPWPATADASTPAIRRRPRRHRDPAGGAFPFRALSSVEPARLPRPPLRRLGDECRRP
jgi:hypothetical protein